MSIEDLSTLRFNCVGTWSPRTAEEAYDRRCVVCGADLNPKIRIEDRVMDRVMVEALCQAGFELWFCSGCFVPTPVDAGVGRALALMLVAVAEVCTRRALGEKKAP